MRQLSLIFVLAGIAVSFASCASNCMGKGVNKYCELEQRQEVITVSAEDVACNEDEVITVR
ncbi:hypothetical protein ACFQ1M_07910 [Sungkyunkwania multivorans]|uniref:Uncharacterized protein n=1 Tax=Sungkyunkwania multivorans TaxID=1173618 RepID=A0ABW3CWI8_9FLAO